MYSSPSVKINSSYDIIFIKIISCSSIIFGIDRCRIVDGDVISEIIVNGVEDDGDEWWENWADDDENDCGFWDDNDDCRDDNDDCSFRDDDDDDCGLWDNDDDDCGFGILIFNPEELGCLFFIF